MSKNNREHQLLALLYRVEELLLELRVGGKDSEDYKNPVVIINDLEDHLQNNQDIICSIPPAVGFTHVGRLHYVDYRGKILTNTTFWMRLVDRIKSMSKAISKFERFDSIYDHNIKQYTRRIGERDL